MLVAVLAVVAGLLATGRLAGRLLAVLAVLRGRLLAGAVLARLLAARRRRLTVAVHLLTLVAGLVTGAVPARLAAVTVTLPTADHSSHGIKPASQDTARRT